MLQVKFYSNKSNAKRALAKIGAEVLAKADEVLVSGDDDQWGFDTGAAVELQKQLSKPVVKVVEPAKVKAAAIKTEYRYEGQCALCGSHESVTWHNEGVTMFCHACSGVFSAKTGRRVNVGYTRENCNSGYTIEKNRETQNGIIKPSAGTRTIKAWEMFDQLRKEGLLDSKTIKLTAIQREMNLNMVSAQYVTWKKFHGLFNK